ncbi:hypothetical protein PsorP6_011778 [Peronosclerospora sorghi]|uniref:Uncharacterized protein n=1 Tax=Peronosclerospora sorghi TaxID=230839 RepID=A0ACC0WJA5_9STRA|nr:hypothetical protein PsorP6_011778 [Peronosclerospora sorghi]
MSTLTSADMGELKRPTTRVHAPPGGGSSWSFGDDSSSTLTGRKRVNPSPTPAQHDTTMESPRAKPAHTSPLGRTDRSVRVALIKTTSDAELVDRAVQNCLEKLKEQSVNSETFTVPSVEQLPYAANKLTEAGGFDSVICFGFLSTQDPQCPGVSASLIQSLMDISVKNVRPVVRAVFIGEPRVASVKIKGGWGAEFAHGVVSLIHLGAQVG